MPCHEYCGLGHSEMWATVQVLDAAAFKPDARGESCLCATLERLMPRAPLGGLCGVRRRCRAGRLADVGAQSAGRTLGTPEDYYMSVTAHGVAMAYVLTTFFIMGFGYFVAETALDRPLPGKAWAWGGFVVARHRRGDGCDHDRGGQGRASFTPSIRR